MKEGTTQTIIILALLVGGVYFLGGEKEAVLPSGQYNVDAGCVWATNVEPMTERATMYSNGQVWLSADADADGTWERYGYRSSGTTTQTYGWPHLVTNYNSYGDNIYIDSSDNQLYVRSSSSYAIFEENYGNYEDAIIPECAGGNPPPPTNDSCWTFTEMVNNLDNNWVECN